MNETVKLKLSTEGVSHIAEGFRAHNAASPTIDPYDGVLFLQKWQQLAPLQRSWIDTPAGIALTFAAEGYTTPQMGFWPQVDGQLALSDLPLKGVEIHEYHAMITETEALDMIADLINGGDDPHALLDNIMRAVANTGRPV